MTSASYLH